MKSVESLPVKTTLLIVSTLTVMAGATIAPSLPAMRQFFEATPNADYWVRLVLTVPALLIAIGGLFAGGLIDRVGRKPVLAIALLLYGLAGSSGLWLDTLSSILVGRALLGLSVAGIMTTATALIADYYSGPARGQFLGLQAAFMSLGGVVFLTVGGFLADVSWRSPFLIYLVALILLPLVVLLLPEPNRQPTASETMTAEPAQFPLQWVLLTFGIALLSQIVFYLIPVQLPFYLKELVNASASQSGMAIALTTLFSAFTSLLYQRIKSRLSFISVYGISFLNMAIGYGMISAATNFGLVLPGLAIAGLGLGLLMPNMSFCLTSIAPGASRGRVLGGLTSSMFLGQFLSPIVSQPLSNQVGLSLTYALAGGIMAICAVVILVIVMKR